MNRRCLDEVPLGKRELIAAEPFGYYFLCVAGTCPCRKNQKNATETSVSLVDVYGEPKAVDVLWDLLSERSVDPDAGIINISHRSLPSYDQHKAFVERKPFAYWYLIQQGVEWLGNVYVTQRNEVGIHLFIDARGRGIGPLALKLLLDRHDPLPAVTSERGGQFIANINPRNARSIKLFEALGFKLIQQTYALDP